MDPQTLQEAAALIKKSKYVTALTGAGISAPSGIPDFRSVKSGLWTMFDPMEVASLAAFRYSPQKFFKWLRPFIQQIITSHPNPAHQGLATLEEQGYLKAIVTQNIDNLHQRAGSGNIFEIHGTLKSMTCGFCYESCPSEPYIEALMVNGEIPRCEHCGHILKPDIILFQEQLHHQQWKAAEEIVLRSDLLVVIGSSLEVSPVSMLPVLAMNKGANLIVINQTPTYVNQRADIVIPEDAATAVPLLVKEILDA